MSFNKVEAALFLPVHVGEFAEALEVLTFLVVVPGADGMRAPVESFSVVADVNLHSHGVAKGNEMPEDNVVPHKPGHHEQDEAQYAGGHRQHPAQFLAMH